MRIRFHLKTNEELPQIIQHCTSMFKMVMSVLRFLSHVYTETHSDYDVMQARFGTSS